MAAAEVVRYVDPGCSGETHDGLAWETAYLSLFDCEAGEQANLTTLGGGDGSWMHIYCRSSGEHPADDTVVYFNGWTTSATNYILIEAASTDRAVKDSWDVTKYRLEGNVGYEGYGLLGIQENYVIIDGLQIHIVYEDAVAYTFAVVFTTQDAANSLVVKNCRILGDLDAASNTVCICIDDADAIVSVENCILYNADTGAIQERNCTSLKVYNCVLYGVATNALEIDHAGAVVRNCAIFNNTDDVQDDSGEADIDYIATDDGDGGVHSISGLTWANEFVNAAGGDFTLKIGGSLEGAGIGPESDADVPTTDIDGTTRSGTTCDIGADEYDAGGAGSIVPLILAYHRRLRA